MNFKDLVKECKDKRPRYKTTGEKVQAQRRKPLKHSLKRINDFDGVRKDLGLREGFFVSFSKLDTLEL